MTSILRASGQLDLTKLATDSSKRCFGMVPLTHWAQILLMCSFRRASVCGCSSFPCITLLSVLMACLQKWPTMICSCVICWCVRCWLRLGPPLLPVVIPPRPPLELLVEVGLEVFGLRPLELLDMTAVSSAVISMVELGRRAVAFAAAAAAAAATLAVLLGVAGAGRLGALITCVG